MASDVIKRVLYQRKAAYEFYSISALMLRSDVLMTYYTHALQYGNESAGKIYGELWKHNEDILRRNIEWNALREMQS
jgi:hypothetical protein